LPNLACTSAFPKDNIKNSALLFSRLQQLHHPPAGQLQQASQQAGLDNHSFICFFI